MIGENQLLFFLENPTGVIDRKIKYKELSYVIFGNKLFWKAPDRILLKYPSESEAYLTIYVVHSGSYGAHQVGHKMKWLLFQKGFY